MMRFSRGGEVQFIAEGKQSAKQIDLVKCNSSLKLEKSEQICITGLINVFSLAPAVYSLEALLKLALR